MILCLDIGNSQIFGGLYEGDEIKLRFRHASALNSTSDQLGVFLKTVLKENGVDGNLHIQKIHISSVVPSLDYSLRAACIKYFNIDPRFLTSRIKTALTIKTASPKELGSDLHAAAIGAIEKFPRKNIIIIDMGTATTFSAINKKREFLGVAILPGIRLSMEALYMNTAKLIAVDIIKPKSVIGRNTRHSIQAGLYFGQLGMIRELNREITEEYFKNDPPIIIGTGGFSGLFEPEKVFDHVLPDLILEGLKNL